MARTQDKMRARDRVRSRRAKLDEERARQAKMVDDAAVAYYEAQDALAAAERAVADANDGMARAVATMVSLGQTNAVIAALCDLSEAEVRVLRKRAADFTPDLQESLEG